MMINVWNWRTGIKVASNKVSSKVSALAFSEDGKCFVTVGNRHVRFWYLEDRRSKINQTVPLMGRNGILGDQKDNFFCDVVAGQGSMSGRFFVITQSGLLCEFNEKRLLDKWVELMTKTASCITAGEEHIFVGCAEGVVRVFSATTLHYVCTLPPPHPLGVEVTTATSPSHLVGNRQDCSYPDAKAIAMDDDHKKVTCIYSDRSMYIWDVHDLKRVGKAWSFLFHSGCIWSLEMYPQLEEDSKPVLPPGSFLTASGDNTIRVWNLNTHMPENTAYKRNIYSNELLKIVYADPSLGSLCNVDYNPAGATDKTDTTYDGKNGVRSIRVSPDGAHLASGDRQGNIRIYDMEYLTEQKCVEAHESDVMCLEYSYTKEGRLLATSGRDRLIHVFDVEANYGLVQTLADHSSSITAVRFMDKDEKLRMVSCGADKSILLRNAVVSPDLQFQLEHHLATKITLYDMVIDPTQKLLATACQDRNVRLYNIQTTKEKKCYRGSAGDEGVLLRIHLDPSGSYAATSCTDKNVCILDFNSGELLATMHGHSEVITGVKFANDLKHIITVSADGCIFVWRLPKEMTMQIKTRLVELGKKLKDTDFLRCDEPLMPNPVLINSSSVDGNFHVNKSASLSFLPRGDDDIFDDRLVGFDDGDDNDDDDEDEDEAFDDEASTAGVNFSPGPLPSWAKAKFGESNSKANDSGQEHVQPKGRWAQRVDHNMEFKSQLDLTQSEDDSVQTDRRRPPAVDKSDPRRETFILPTKNVSSLSQDIRGSTGDLRTSLKTNTPQAPKSIETPRRREANFFKSDTSLNTSGSGARKRWSERFDLVGRSSLDHEDTDELDTGSDTTEIIYLPTESDLDPSPSSYKVFAVENLRKSSAKTNMGSAFQQDDASESTDPISLEDEEDVNDETLISSTPTTPSDPDKVFMDGTSDKEDFVRENFEEDTFSQIPLEKFLESSEALEQQALERGSGKPGTAAAAARLPGFESSAPFSPRLSLSARFMSRAGPSVFKNSISSHVTNRQDTWFNRNKMEMSRAMDETRRSLLAMNTRNDLIGSNSPEKEDPPSPPTKLEEVNEMLKEGNSPGQYATSPPSAAFGTSPWDCHCKNLRRMWAAFTLSKDCIMEEFTVPGFSFDVGSPPESLVGDPNIVQDFLADSIMESQQSRGRQMPPQKSAADTRKPEAFFLPVKPETCPKQQQPQNPYDTYLHKHLQLYHSSIPTPMSSPRPHRARRGSLKSPSAAHGDTATVSSSSYFSSSSLPSPSSSSTAPSSPEKESNFLKAQEDLKLNNMFRVHRTKSASPRKASPHSNSKTASNPRRSVSNNRRSTSTSRTSSATSAVSSSTNCSSIKTSNARNSHNNGRNSTSSSTKNGTTSGRGSTVQCSKASTRSSTSSSRDRDSTSSCGRESSRNSTGSSSDTLSPSSPASCTTVNTVMTQGRGRGVRPKASSSPSSTITTTTFCNNCRTFSKSRSPSLSSSSRDRVRDLDGRLKSSPKDLLQQKPVRTSVGLTSPVKASPPVITSPSARRITQERERRRSSTTQEDGKENTSGPLGSSSGSGTLPRRTRPSYFKPTQSSKNKTSRTSGDGQEAPLSGRRVTSVFNSGGTSSGSGGGGKLSSRMRLSSSKMAQYASTPNLMSSLDDDDEGGTNADEDEDIKTRQNKPKVSKLKFTSTTNLRLLSDLSRSVPDVNDEGSSTDSSSTGSGPGSHVTRPSSLGKTFPIHSSSAVIKRLPQHPAKTTQSTFNNMAAVDQADTQPLRRKTSASEMTLDQAKSILLGKSGLLPSKVTPTSDSGAGTSVRGSTSPESMPSSLASTVTSGGSPPRFDLTSASPAQRALVQDIEQTANSLRHQQQRQLQNNFSPQRQELSNLEASPQDLPERDQPAHNQRRIAPKSLSISLENGSVSGSSQTFHQQHMDQRVPATNSTFLVQGDQMPPSSLNRDGVDHEKEEETGLSVRERIAQFLNPRPVLSTTDLDRSRLSLPLDKKTVAAPNPVSVAQCQTLIQDFYSKLDSLKDVFHQVEGKTDDNSCQVMSLLGAAFHQSHKLMADLASKAPSPPGNDGIALQQFGIKESSSTSQARQPPSAANSSSSSSSSSVKGPQEKAFQSQAATHQPKCLGGESLPGTLKVSNSSAQRSQDLADSSLSEAVKTMLEPLLSHFSSELTQELLKFIQDGSGKVNHHQMIQQ
ncbi:mitogen-activated protein kinase-binding protein 1 [Elysia marginata]|uniref:Mitogen-activated protein kinase-binding protein 1 n=1 Tax=Elysia marginata TaxID=1093978 RepID=A0AAV4GDH0_9GAST|nr:mitogen-activated protein kinase-binding protein 1 [Elysia marginata]